MSEGMPTREQVAILLWDSADDGGRPEWTWEYLTERADRGEGDYADIRAEYYQIADRVLALFSQPSPNTPSAEQIETLRQLACDGSGVCQSPLHVHGCYSDLDGRACDEPDEHPVEPPRIEDMAPGTTENPEGWTYSTDPAGAERCGVAYVGYEGGEGACEYLPNHPGRHWSAQWGSWSL